MGCGFAGHSKGTLSSKSPDPNPWRFKIKRYHEYNRHVGVVINYPDATTYKGDKVLVFKGSFSKLKGRSNIDPHFTGKALDAIARFPGDPQGWDMAIRFMEQVL